MSKPVTEPVAAPPAATVATADAVERFRTFLSGPDYPCVGARAALAKGQVRYFVGDDLGSADDDRRLLAALYEFIEDYRRTRQLYSTFVALFEGPRDIGESAFERILWDRLAALHTLDRETFGWDPEVSPDPQSPEFSYSLRAEAMFVVGMHPQASRTARRFAYPALIFNLHDQFERLRQQGTYDSMCDTIRDRDTELDGDINPMLAEFGEDSEAGQYSGRSVDDDWQCPMTPKPPAR